MSDELRMARLLKSKVRAYQAAVETGGDLSTTYNAMLQAADLIPDAAPAPTL